MTLHNTLHGHYTTQEQQGQANGLCCVVCLSCVYCVYCVVCVGLRRVEGDQRCESCPFVYLCCMCVVYVCVMYVCMYIYVCVCMLMEDEARVEDEGYGE